jgi:thioredoxin-like negative regulator of GroEL
MNTNPEKRNLHTLEDYHKKVQSEPALLFYFSTPQCQVCKVLRPKVEQMLEQAFPRMGFIYVDMEKLPRIAGQMQIFAAPTILVYFEGKESLRKSRNISLEELAKEISRSYGLIFD